jgi:hypothetical protein
VLVLGAAVAVLTWIFATAVCVGRRTKQSISAAKPPKRGFSLLTLHATSLSFGALVIRHFMKLSEQEARWLKTWEKRERQWPFTRWFCIFNGLLSLVVGILIGHLIVAADWPKTSVLLLVPIFFFFKSGMWFGIALSKWGGDIMLRLVLRLIREHADTDA